MTKALPEVWWIFNRCGVPLIEIVSEPDMHSSAEAKAYLETIKSILQYIDISDCKMQEGSIRCDINVSVCRPGEPMGTRCEMKNVNTFSGAVRAIEYEAKRQIEVLEAGGEIHQETRRWDDAKGQNFLLRSKRGFSRLPLFPGAGSSDDCNRRRENTTAERRTAGVAKQKTETLYGKLRIAPF